MMIKMMRMHPGIRGERDKVEMGVDMKIQRDRVRDKVDGVGDFD